MIGNLILYIFIFAIGITFGSFFTLAVYRIPLGQDITHTRSYCPNCNHKLKFWDMIPVFSYIFLGGKCRYCKQKIKIRYLLLEVFSGLVCVIFAMSIKLNIYNLNISSLAYFITGVLYFAGLFIIAGIDKERKEIRNELLLYIIIVETVYIIYLYIVEKVNIYRYVIYLFMVCILVIINNIYFTKKKNNNYTLESLILLFTMLIFTYETCTILTIIFTLLIIGIYGIVDKVKNNKNIKGDNKNNEKSLIPIGFYLCVSNIIMLISTNMIIFHS